MLRLSWIASTCWLLLAAPAAAQFTDDFSDGDFTRNPAWAGSTDRWAVATLDGNPALRTDGVAASDTIHLAVPSAVSVGTWSFTFAHRGVNLSSFNGARIFLTADRADLTGAVTGYSLQLGTNNSDEVRLYRHDGDPGVPGNRVLLGASPAPLLAGDDNTLAFTVTRSDASAWTVAVDGVPVLTAHDDAYRTSRYFGVWVKHTQAAAQGYFFDDFSVAGEATPVDTTPPALLHARALDAERVEVTFSEAVDGCSAERYTLSGGIGAPAGMDACPPGRPDAFVLRLPRPLASGTTYTLTVRNVADPAGNVLAEASVDFTFINAGEAPPAPRDVVVNEILYDPPEADLEFVELFNRSGQPLDLSRFRLADDRLAPVSVLDQPHVLPPGGYAVLARSAEALRTAFPGIAVIEPESWPTLNNGGDAVVLFFGETVIDSVAYAPHWGGDGVSLERKDPDGPSNSRFNFGASVAAAGATPGAQNSLFAPDETPPLPVFAEQVAEDALHVYFDEPLASASIRAQSFALDDNRAPTRVFIQEEGTLLHLRFDAALTGRRLTARGLQDLNGNTLSVAGIDLAYRAAPGDLVVNEILYDPLADRFDDRPDQPEYVEFFNRAAHAVSLRGLYWTDVPDENGTADSLHVGAAFAIVAPHGFAVAFADPGASAHPTTDSKLARAFPDVDFSDAMLLPVARTTLGLVNAGGLIHLRRADGLGLDSVYYHPGWHHPNLLDATGVSVERIAPERGANDTANWTSSVAAQGGTPGRANSIFLPPGTPPSPGRLVVEPSPFSPDRDGHDDVTALRYTLAQDAALLRVRIFDARGRLVRTLEPAALTGRSDQLLWDGLDDAGRDLHIGIYVVLLEALDVRGGTVAVFKRPVVLARRLD